MEPLEEYEAAKLSSFSPAITYDGKYFLAMKSAMLEKFKNSPDCEARVAALSDNGVNIFKKILALKERNDDKNLLLVGKVQSGKTSNMEMAIALAFDNSFNTLILYGGYDNTLLNQAVTRFKSAFEKPKGMSEETAQTEWVNVFTIAGEEQDTIASLDSDAIEEILDAGGRLIFICRKGPDAIGKFNAFFEKHNSPKIRAMIFDDEGDQASLNTEFRKQKSSPTYREICAMKDILSNPPYLSVTATPQALIFSPESSRLEPKDLILIQPGNGYTGLAAYHSGSSTRVVNIDDEMDECLQQDTLPESLWTALYAYIVSSALLRKNGLLTKTQMIVHFDKRQKKHKQVYDKLNKYLTAFQKNIAFGQTETIERKMADFRSVFDNDTLIEPPCKRGLAFDDIKDDLEFVIKKAAVAMQNGVGKETMAKLGRKRYQIRVGADLLQRGVSFDELITTYFTRWPKGISNQDTQTQRARWLGYRTKYFDYCHVFTTEEIELKFSELSDVEYDLWDEMAQVESGEKKLGDIMILADPKMRPSRRNASDFDVKVFGRKWLNQRIGNAVQSVLDKNNRILEEIVEANASRLVPTTIGSTNGQPTAWRCSITTEEFQKLIAETEFIFSEAPFGGANTLMKAAEGHAIDLLLFWDPNNTDYGKHVFGIGGKDNRERTFMHVDEGLRVKALQQGADKVDPTLRTYEGDAKVIENEDALSIQVFPITPKSKTADASAIVGKFQYMYSIHTPKPVGVYGRK